MHWMLALLGLASNAEMYTKSAIFVFINSVFTEHQKSDDTVRNIYCLRHSLAPNML